MHAGCQEVLTDDLSRFGEVFLNLPFKLRPVLRKVVSVGPETKDALPGAKKFKKNWWRPLAIVVLATWAQVYNEDQTPINPNHSSRGTSHHRILNPEELPKYQDETRTLSSNSVTLDELKHEIKIVEIKELKQPNSQGNPELSKTIPKEDVRIHALSVEPQMSHDQTKELETIISKMSARPELFGQRQIEDIKLYYPIYKTVAERYNFKWYLLWIIHEAESTASRDPNAFNGKSGHVGGFQRDPKSWTQSIVEEASKGLEDLAALPQRDPTDWKEAAFAAWLLKRNIGNSVLEGLLAYSAPGPAYYRFNLYQQFSQIFD